MKSMPSEPLNHHDVRELIRQILSSPDRIWRTTGHAEGRMDEHNMTEVDAVNVARGGMTLEDKTVFKDGTWRYQIYTPAMSIVIAFEDDFQTIVLITCWRTTE